MAEQLLSDRKTLMDLDPGSIAYRDDGGECVRKRL